MSATLKLATNYLLYTPLIPYHLNDWYTDWASQLEDNFGNSQINT